MTPPPPPPAPSRVSTAVIGAVAAVAVACVWLLCAVAPRTALARPVLVGRYVEIPYGVGSDHPYPTESGDARRSGRSRAAVTRSAPHRVWQVRLPGSIPQLAGRHRGRLALRRLLPRPDEAAADRRDSAWDAPIGPVRGVPSVTPFGDLATVLRDGTLVLVSPDGEVRERRAIRVSHGSPLVLPDGFDGRGYAR